MGITENLVIEKISRFINYLKEQKYGELEQELKELTTELLTGKDNLIQNSELQLIYARFEDLLKHTDRRFEELLRFSEKRFEDMNRRFEDMNKRFEEVNKRFDDVYRRFDDMNKRFEDMNKRFEDMNKRFDDMNKRFEDMNKRFEDMNRRFDDVNKRFQFLQWFLGIFLSLFLGIMSFFQAHLLYSSKTILEEIKQIKLQSGK